MKTGNQVRLIQPEIRGVVLERRINKATDQLELLVAWPENGEKVERWLDANLVEAVERPAAPAEAEEVQS